MEVNDYLKFFSIEYEALLYNGPEPTNDLDAVNMSIAKWTTVAKCRYSVALAIGPLGCGLCSLYNIYPNQCEDCPIYNHTGARWCQHTPFGQYVHLDSCRAEKDIPGSDFQKAAKREVAFLEKIKKEILENG